MNAEQELRVQAWLDGELSERQREEVSRFIASDEKAEALLGELRLTKAMLLGNEAVFTVPESREFFWGKVQREIERAQVISSQQVGAFAWVRVLRRFAVPIGGMALVVFLTVLSMQVTWNDKDSPTGQNAELENLCDEVGSIAYKSQSDNVFVVYLYDRELSAATDGASETSNEGAIEVQ